MAIYVHVKHYLNAEGMEHFDNWFTRVRQFMSQKTGYISLEHTKYPAQSLVHIVVCFEDTQTLEAWVDEPVHDQLINELDAYRAKPYWEVARAENASSQWDQLSYEKILPATEKKS